MTTSLSGFSRLALLAAFCLTACEGGLKEGLTPPPPPGIAASVAVSPQGATLASVDDTLDFTAVVRDADQNVLDGVPVTWSSSDNSVMTVGSSGRAQSRSNGSASITATAGSVSGSSTATVQQVATALAVSPPAISIPAGSSTTLSATLNDANGHSIAGMSVAWASGDQGIATVDGSGAVTGLTAGSTTVTASSGNLSDAATITVTTGSGPTVASVTISPSSGSLASIDQTLTFTAVARD